MHFPGKPAPRVGALIASTRRDAIRCGPLSHDQVTRLPMHDAAQARYPSKHSNCFATRLDKIRNFGH
jgi:hypothetical protein